MNDINVKPGITAEDVLARIGYERWAVCPTVFIRWLR